MFKYDFKLEVGDQNVGTVYLPNKEASNIPVVIYCHGWSGKRQLSTPTQAFCERAMKENIAFVTFDFFGCGDTGGEYGQMTYARWKKNLSEIFSWVVSQPFANRDKVGCYAVSAGSATALRLAAKDDRIAFIVSVGTCISAHLGMSCGGGPSKLLADNVEKLLSGGTVKYCDVDFNKDFFIDAIGNAPIHTIHKVKCPVLFIQGTADNTYRCADARIAYDIMHNVNPKGQTEHIELDGGTHVLDNMAEKAVDIIFKWLMPLVL